MRRNTLLALWIAGLCLAVSPTAPATAGVNVWTPIGPDGGNVLALAADPQRAGILYAGTSGGLFKSTDGGTSWSWSSRGLKPDAIQSLAVAPSNGEVVYAGTPKGVFASSDGAASWRDTRFRRIFTTLAVDPRDPRRVWAGTANDGLYKSTDAGAHWQQVATGSARFARVLSLVFDPFDPNTLYAGVDALGELDARGIFKSTDGGVTWRQSAFPPDIFQGTVQLAVDPTTRGLIYASFAPPQFSGDPAISTLRSADGGATWQQTEGGYPIAVDRNGVVYAGNRRSVDHGVTWQPVVTLPGATRYVASPAAGGVLWAGTERFGVFRSRDRAATWQSATKGLHATAVLTMAVDPRQSRVIYAGTVQTGPVKTFNTGARWRTIQSGLPEDEAGIYFTSTLALDPQLPRTLYLGWSSPKGLARSDDGGENWHPLRSTANPADIFWPYELVVDPTAPGVVFFNGEEVPSGGERCRVSRGDNLGQTWHCLPPFGAISDLSPDARLVPNPARPGVFWLFDRDDQLWKSTDHGTSWTPIRARGLALAGIPRSMAVHPTRPNRLFLGTERRFPNALPTRLWLSDDGGVTWRAWGNGDPAVSQVTGLRIDPRQPAIMYAVVDDLQDPDRIRDQSGVYRSSDGGRTFQPLRNGLTGRVRQLEIDPRDPRRLFAATETHGIYMFTRQ